MAANTLITAKMVGTTMIWIYAADGFLQYREKSPMFKPTISGDLPRLTQSCPCALTSRHRVHERDKSRRSWCGTVCRTGQRLGSARSCLFHRLKLAFVINELTQINMPIATMGTAIALMLNIHLSLAGWINTKGNCSNLASVQSWTRLAKRERMIKSLSMSPPG